MVQAMEDLERTWNHKFNYPWTFFNDAPFTDEFKTKTQAVTKAKCFYGISNHLRHFIQNHTDPSAPRNNTQRTLGRPPVD